VTDGGRWLESLTLKAAVPIRAAIAREPANRVLNPKSGEWMRLGFCLIPATLATSLALLASPSHLFAQEPRSGSAVATAEELVDAPQPQFMVTSLDPTGQQTPSGQDPSAGTQQPAPGSTPAQTGSSQSSSSSQTPAPQSDAEKSQREKAEEQIKEQEKQRVVGIIPSFNTSYRSDAVSLTAVQKLRLAFRSATDPVIFASAFLVAGYHEALDDDQGFRWGIEGYGRRTGAAYLDSFNGDMIGNGFLPALLHQDPRYFRLGHGAARHRVLYALATNVICKHDNTGKWEPNYSNVLGNIASGAISNLYYPASNTGIGLTISNGLIVTAEGGVGSLFQEFWPDLSRKWFHKDPTHGLDAQARAKDQAAKEAKQAKQNQQ
jgi:hypothetical protein